MTTKKSKETSPIVTRLENEVRILSAFVRELEKNSLPTRTYQSDRMIATWYDIPGGDGIVRVITFDTAKSTKSVSRELRWASEFIENPCSGLLVIASAVNGTSVPHDAELWSEYEAAAKKFAREST